MPFYNVSLFARLGHWEPVLSASLSMPGSLWFPALRLPVIMFSIEVRSPGGEVEDLGRNFCELCSLRGQHFLSLLKYTCSEFKFVSEPLASDNSAVLIHAFAFYSLLELSMPL